MTTLPPFCTEFFVGSNQELLPGLVLPMHTISLYFSISSKENPVFSKMERMDFTLDYLDQISVTDLEEYMEYLKYRFNEHNQKSLTRTGNNAQNFFFKSFYNYFFRTEKLKTNPAALVQLPKLHEKEIIRLDIDEVALLLDAVEQGDGLTDKQKAFHNRTKLRDLALLTLLLGTGIRVSECVGLDLNDIDFKNGGIHIHRKGGKEVTVYFGTEVETALQDYLDERNSIIPEEGSENALFLSLQKKRMNVRSVENLVKKYARIVTPLKDASYINFEAPTELIFTVRSGSGRKWDPYPQKRRKRVNRLLQ